jgi:glycosyltransferase involved in cell wall biosynthesis
MSDDPTPVTTVKPEPRPAQVALGMTVYNGERYLSEALDSILSQSYRDFTLVVLDDCSGDRSTEILADRASSDARVICLANQRRMGMVATWVKVFRLAQAYCPGHRYFGWCSDHDSLFPDWLSSLVDELDRREEVVLAYPETLNVDSEGKLLGKPLRPRRFNSEGLKDPIKRFHHINRRMSGAGNMIYGLMRSEALDAVGVYRPVLQPDRLALIELSLIGQIYQVPKVLRYRRVVGAASIARQRATLFDPSDDERKVVLPWYLMHAVAFFRAYSSQPAPATRFSLIRIFALSASILCWQFKADLDKRLFHLKRAVRSLYRAMRAPNSVQ